MAKRFTDSEKWERTWFRKLPDKYKLLWLYLLDKCDVAGIWYEDFEVASFLLGHKIDPYEAKIVLEKQIEVRGNRWLIKDFIHFQYKNLTEANKIFHQVDQKIQEFRAWGMDGGGDGGSMPLLSPLNGGMVKDKDNTSLSLRGDKGVGEGEIVQNGIPMMTVDDVVELWNGKAHENLPRVKLIAKAREVHVKSRLQSFPHRHQWEHLVERINASPFLTGLKTTWKCDFDWVMNPTNMAKILEGNYDDNGNRPKFNNERFSAR